ncbi:hypothetical protein GCM10010211_09620 [Streptomyces albospinus]|uniref:Uncharacterized protein n=1 Tax=Streptomyces albospinus TaxID=285515 RepID=A0ABQ2UPK6_9ACTN|nr:hypothetical protein [Streptomyces albospinus]GGU47689.1 hypothetical protein GCM10010211_09620 [Streptomyces albospinus]
MGMLLLLTACQHGASAAPSPASPPPTQAVAPRRFTVYDTTFYAHLDLTRYGAAKADIIYEGRVAALSGQPVRSPDGRPTTELRLPPKAAYQNLVRQHMANPGPLVLDYETLYLTGTPEVAERHYRKLSTLLTWTREVAPHKRIGFWDLLGNTSRRYYPWGRALAAHEDVFLPSLYTDSKDSEARWQHRLDQARAEAKQLAPGKPVYPFLWPQFRDRAGSGRYVSPALWSYELQACGKADRAAVVWGGGPHGNSDTAWLDILKRFLGHGS